MTVLTKDLGFGSGKIIPPWDEMQLSGTHTPNHAGTDALDYGVASGDRFPGFSEYAYMKINPPAYASSSNPGWHVRCFPAYYNKDIANANHPSYIGDEIWARGAFYCPSGENSNGLYNGGQVIEFMHPNDWPQLNDPSKNIVHAQIAHFMLFRGKALETWDGQSFHPYSGSDHCLCFRIATGYVPGIPTDGPQDQTFWHANLLAFDPFPMDIPVWFILHVKFHEYAGGNPPGGLTKKPHSLPVPSGADTAPGTVELWCIKKATRPTLEDFGKPMYSWKPENNTGIPTLLYRSSNGDGTGVVVHDAPYGPAGPGPYDSGATVSSPTNLKSSVSFAGIALDDSFDSAVSALTGQDSTQPPPPPPPPPLTDTDLFKESLVYLDNASLYDNWIKANCGKNRGGTPESPASDSEAGKWFTYRDAVLSGQHPTKPTMATAFGSFLVSLGDVID